MPARRRYTDDERAACLAALAANGGNVKKTAAACGVPIVTLRQWAKGSRHPEAIQMSHGKKKDLGTKLNELAHKLAGAMPGKIKDASLRDVSVSLGVTIDKAQLLTGKPTTIHGGRVGLNLTKLSDEQLNQLDALLAAAESDAGNPGGSAGGEIPASANGVH
jgi:hypothetical protein